MKVNQIYQLLNSINAQMWGASAITTNDLTGLISLGKSLSLDQNSADAYLGKLVDRIGKTVIRTLDVELEYPNLFVNEYQFGCMLQKVNIKPFTVIENSDYNIGNNNFTPTFADVYKPDIDVKYFTDSQTFAIRVSIPEDLFFSAFLSETAMNTFINGIMETMTDNMVMYINNLSRTAVNNFIAEKIKNNNGVVNILGLYNAGKTGDDVLAAADALYSKDFLRFAGMIIRNYIGYLGEPSKLYNVDGMLRVTQRDNMHIIMLRDFASAFETMYFAETFKDITNLPMYTEINHWQGSGNTTPTFANNSKINIIPSSASNGDPALEQDGIIAVFADRQAIAVGLNKRRVGKFANDIDGYVNTKSSATIQYINDLSENGVVFIIQDAKGITVDKSTLTFANSSAADQTITATTAPAGETVTWKSSKSTVATVADGVVSAVGTGTCKITATTVIGGITYTAETSVTVG